MKQMKEYLVYGLIDGKKKEILGSIKGFKESNIHKRLHQSGSLLDTPSGSKYPTYLLVEKTKEAREWNRTKPNS